MKKIFIVLITATTLSTSFANPATNAAVAATCSAVYRAASITLEDYRPDFSVRAAKISDDLFDIANLEPRYNATRTYTNKMAELGDNFTKYGADRGMDIISGQLEKCMRLAAAYRLI